MVKEKYVSVDLFKKKLQEMTYRPYMSGYPTQAPILHGLDAAKTLEHYHHQNYQNTVQAVNMAMSSMINMMVAALDECAIDGGQCFLCKSGPNDAEPDDNYCSSGGFKPSV